jgi:hypothetical protein
MPGLRLSGSKWPPACPEISFHHSGHIDKPPPGRNGKADRMVKDCVAKPRMHLFWWNLDETYDKVQARMRATIASGEASENDEFTWRRLEGDGSDN